MGAGGMLSGSPFQERITSLLKMLKGTEKAPKGVVLASVG